MGKFDRWYCVCHRIAFDLPCHYFLGGTYPAKSRHVCGHPLCPTQHRLPSCKLNVYDHDIRIPMVIMGPGIQADSTFDFIASNVDLAPTFVSLAGGDPTTLSPPMDGKSVAAQLIKTGDRITADVLNTVRSPLLFCCLFLSS